MSDQEPAWGTDGVVSLPQPMPSANIEMIDMEGFCFTPSGIRVNMTEADREEFLRSGYGPVNPGQIYGE